MNPSTLDALRVAETYRRLAANIDVVGVAALFSLSRTISLTNQLSDRFFSRFGRGVSNARYSLLRALYLSEDKQRALIDLARELDVTAQNVTYLLSTLEREGLAERVVSKVDRRVVHAHLTPAGEALCDEVMPKALDFFADLVAPFSDEEKLLLTDLLGKLHSHLVQQLESAED